MCSMRKRWPCDEKFWQPGKRWQLQASQKQQRPTGKFWSYWLIIFPSNSPLCLQEMVQLFIICWLEKCSTSSIGHLTHLRFLPDLSRYSSNLQTRGLEISHVGIFQCCRSRCVRILTDLVLGFKKVQQLILCVKWWQCAGRLVLDDEEGWSTEVCLRCSAVSTTMAAAGEAWHGHELNPHASALVRDPNCQISGFLHGTTESGQTCMALQLDHSGWPHTLPAPQWGGILDHTSITSATLFVMGIYFAAGVLVVRMVWCYYSSC